MTRHTPSPEDIEQRVEQRVARLRELLHGRLGRHVFAALFAADVPLRVEAIAAGSGRNPNGLNPTLHRAMQAGLLNRARVPHTNAYRYELTVEGMTFAAYLQQHPEVSP